VNVPFLRPADDDDPWLPLELPLPLEEPEEPEEPVVPEPAPVPDDPDVPVLPLVSVPVPVLATPVTLAAWIA
jgi:hypothetical protein